MIAVNREVNILGININDLSYEHLLSYIETGIYLNEKRTAAYVNVNSINQALDSIRFYETLHQFDLRHSDGFGVFLASKVLHGADCLENRNTGSDFYPHLVKKIIERNWRIYILGDTKETLELIQRKNPGMIITGMSSGYGFYTEKVLEEIRKNRPEILLVGLGTPLQEDWIIDNLQKISANVVISVGDGLKVLAGTKFRGPQFIRKIGLEWTFRLLQNPKRYGRRYLLGIPRFLLRIVKEKINNRNSQ